MYTYYVYYVYMYTYHVYIFTCQVYMYTYHLREYITDHTYIIYIYGLKMVLSHLSN